MRPLIVSIAGICLSLLFLAGLFANSAKRSPTSATELSGLDLARFSHAAARASAVRAYASQDLARRSPVATTAAQASHYSIPSEASKWSRRKAFTPLVAPLLSQVLPKPSLALQGAGQIAGRVPGFGPAVDGVKAYTRPEGKSGGHGVGWSVIPQYTLKMPDSFQETAVSIADPEGTEIDTSFKSATGDKIAILVLPILRFKDVGFNARVSIDDLGTPEKLIKGLGPEFTRGSFTEDDIVAINKVIGARNQRLNYDYELDPRMYVRATTCGDRLYVVVVKGGESSRLWRKSKSAFEDVAKSFDILDDDLCKKEGAKQVANVA